MNTGAAARLRTIILVDVTTTLAAAAFMVAIRVGVVHDGYLTLLTVIVVAAGGVMASGLLPLRRGRVKRVMLHLAVANWSIAIIAATIATFCWPLMVWTALLPSVLAAALLSGRELAAYVATSVVVSFGVVLVGLLQDFSGFSGHVDEWVRDTVMIFTAPGLVAMVALMAWQNSTSMQSMLSDVTRSRAELADQADELRRSRARVVAATDRERRRIERDLHDGAQQRLIGIGIGLSRARALCESDPATAATMLDTLREQLRSAHDDVRDLAQGVYPPVLTEHGLEAALQSAADRSSVPVTISLGRLRRHPPTTEAAVYFCCVEALQNAAKHGSASRILLAGDADDSMLWISVTDDGGGFDPALATAGSGIIGMRDRLGSIGGRLEVSPSQGGSTVRCVVPIGTS
jgi:signal transduction histidine kinase